MSCVMSSSRVQISFTGAPTAFDASTAAGTKSTSRRRPKPPPSRVVWTLTWLGLQSRRVGRGRLRHLLHLRADVHIAAVGFDVGRAIHRLHGRVRQQRQLVHGRERLGRRLERLRRVAALERGGDISLRAPKSRPAAAALSSDQIAGIVERAHWRPDPSRSAGHRAPCGPARSAPPRRRPRSRSSAPAARPASLAQRPSRPIRPCRPATGLSAIDRIQHAGQLARPDRTRRCRPPCPAYRAGQAACRSAETRRGLERHVLRAPAASRRPRPARRSCSPCPARSTTLAVRARDSRTDRRATCCAAAAINIMRACAPALRSFSHASVTLLLVPVI